MVANTFWGYGIFEEILDRDQNKLEISFDKSDAELKFYLKYCIKSFFNSMIGLKWVKLLNRVRSTKYGFMLKCY